MRRFWRSCAAALLAAGSASAQPACPGTAALDVLADNRTGAPISIQIDGELLDPAASCSGPGATAYAETTLQCGAVTGSCGAIAGLRPGAWVHRIRLTVPGSDPQAQAQTTVLLAADAGNPVRWTIYPRTFVVADDRPDTLLEALDAAKASTAATSEPVLVTFSRAAFPSADMPGTIALRGDCGTGGRRAAICFTGSDIVIDGLDARARPGAVVWSMGDEAGSVLRVSGHDNVFRGIVFQGSKAPPPCEADTIAITGREARNNVVEQSVVLGPTCGDGVGVDAGASGTVIRHSRLTGAQDRGLKANGASVTIADSCVHDNAKGGMQSTLGGDLFAEANVVQRNRGGTGGNGLTAIDKCRDDNLGCTRLGPSSRLATRGNIVRFSEGRGLSVRDNASGTFDSDYVASSGVKGAEVETTGTVPRDAQGNERVPSARFHGVALVCNSSDGHPGVGAETRLESGHAPPDVSWGDAQHPGRNAFTSNRGRLVDGANFLLTNVTTPIPAIGNQWGSCPDTACAEETIRAQDIRPAPNDTVALVLPGEIFEGPRAREPAIDAVTPPRPRAGDIVRIYGEGFDAINGNPTRDRCPSVALPSCAAEQPCPTGPCLEGTCPCSIRTDAVSDPPNLVVIRSNGALITKIAPDAVTPTMLAFTMPWDCAAPITVEVEKKAGPSSPSVSAAIPLCDPTGCGEQPSWVGCDDGDPSTAGDHCDGDGGCVGDPVPLTSTTSTSTIQPSTTTTPATTSTLPPAPTTSTIPSGGTTTTTLPVCNPCAPSTCGIRECAKPGLRRRVAKLARRTCTAVQQTGRAPRQRIVRRLQKALERCGAALPIQLPTPAARER